MMKINALAFAVALALGGGTLAGHTTQAQAQGKDEKAQAAEPTRKSVSKLIQDWPQTSRLAVRQMMEKYGAPDEATPTRVIWFDNGPWKRTVVTNEPTDHDFPMPHQDVMEQVIDYQVPPHRVDELAAYDGSVYVDRTRGEMSARCDAEAANFIALNLAHDIIEDKRSVEEARKEYADLVVAHMTKEKAVPYAEKLTFDAPKSTGFSDEPIIAEETIEKVKKAKQAKMKEGRAEGAAGGTAKDKEER